MKIGIAGYGFVGQAHESIFKQSHTVIISDPVKEHYGDLRHADMIIVCVSTPEADNGSCDMSNVLDVLRNAPDVPILIKSTISLEGWNTIQELYPDREICFSPEFLRAASALQDFKNCNTILIWGSSDIDSWIPAHFPSCGQATPHDENFEKKPAYFGIEEGLKQL